MNDKFKASLALFMFALAGVIFLSTNTPTTKTEGVVAQKNKQNLRLLDPALKMIVIKDSDGMYYPMDEKTGQAIKTKPDGKPLVINQADMAKLYEIQQPLIKEINSAELGSIETYPQRMLRLSQEKQAREQK